MAECRNGDCALVMIHGAGAVDCPYSDECPNLESSITQTVEPAESWPIESVKGQTLTEPGRTRAATVYALELDRFQDNLDRKLEQIQDSGAQVQDIQFDGGRGHFAALIIYKGGTSC